MMSSKSFTFQSATETHASALDKLVNSAYRGDSSRKGWTTEADLLDGIRINEAGIIRLMNEKGSVILVAIENGTNEILACVHLQEKKKSLYLGMLTVEPTLQNSGIGKKLLQAAEDKAHQEQLNSVFMTVISERTELINWYLRHGYKDTGRREPFPEGDPNFGLPKKKLEFVVLEKLITSKKSKPVQDRE